MDITEINNAILELENGETTYAACDKLAMLYTVRDHLTQETRTSVDKELKDIFPSYANYRDVKADFQMHKTNQESVIDAFASLCNEIEEFIMTLYCNTNLDGERQELISALSCIVEISQ